MLSSEVKWVALSEAVKEVMIQLLESIVRVDNIGAIFVAGNITTTSCTKCNHIKYKFVNEYVKAREVKIMFVMSAENDNIFTK